MRRNQQTPIKALYRKIVKIAELNGFSIIDITMYPDSFHCVFKEDPGFELMSRSNVRVTLDTRDKENPVFIENILLKGAFKKKGDNLIGSFSYDEAQILQSAMDIATEFADDLIEALKQ